jgi:hypothetical protein
MMPGTEQTMPGTRELFDMPPKEVLCPALPPGRVSVEGGTSRR